MPVSFLEIVRWVIFSIIAVVVACTFVVAYLDYLERREEYREKVDSNSHFYHDYCTDSSRLSRYPQLTDECHASKHAAFDDPSQRALRDVLARWSLCDEKGCDVLMDRFTKYFSLGAIVLALVVGAWGTALIYRVSGRRFIESLPTHQ